MIKIQISEKRILEQAEVDALVFFVEHDKVPDQVQQVADRYYAPLLKIIEQRQFKGAAGSSLVIPAPFEGDIRYLIFVGLGSEKGGKLDVELYRRALGDVVRIAEKEKIKRLAFNVPPAQRFSVDSSYLAREATIIVHIASYQFDKYITDEKRKLAHDLDITFVITGEEREAYADGVARGEIIAASVNKARLWVDEPPSSLPPAEFSKLAQHIAKKHNLAITVFDEEEIKKMGMGGLAGVAAGSEQDANLVILEYTAAKKDAPRIGIVGKGITFDSGGLSLKPPQHMETMKEDMSGAAAVLATMEAVAQLKPDVHVVAVMPLAENLPSGTATKPGDIVTLYNGKTAEVLNTDAEGRLILADGLSYAVKHYKLDALFDIATLTGACAHALGPFFAGLMGKHDDVLERIERAGITSGDRAWRLPFTDDYKIAIKSNYADISNIGNIKIMAGAITAGFFLQNFVGDVPWAHLDIAGVAFNVPDRSYFRTGATGYGVRLLTELITHW